MSDPLTLEDFATFERRFAETISASPLMRKVLAAARAHLERFGAPSAKPYPYDILGHPGDSVTTGPDGVKLIRHDDPVPSPTPSSTVVSHECTLESAGYIKEDGSIKPWPSPDAGLAERLRRRANNEPMPDGPWTHICDEAAADLEAKERWNDLAQHNRDAADAQEEIIEAQAAEIERLHKAWDYCIKDQYRLVDEITTMRKHIKTVLSEPAYSKASRIARAALMACGHVTAPDANDR